MALPSELVPAFLIMGLSAALVGTLWIVINEEAKRRLAEAYAETPPATVDLATDFVDLAQLQLLAGKVDKAYANRFERLQRMSEGDRNSFAGVRLAYVCSRLCEATICLEEVVVLDGSRHLSQTDHAVKMAAADMLDSVGEPKAIIPLKGSTHLKLLH